MKASRSFPHNAPSAQRNKRKDSIPLKSTKPLSQAAAAAFGALHDARPRMPGAHECYWCGLPYEHNDPTRRRTRDHLLPRYHAGTDDESNIVGAHSRCNASRGVALDWVPFHVHGQIGRIVRYAALSADMAQEDICE